MKTDSGRTVSVWLGTSEIETRKPLDASVRVDVCVVGAGLAGISTAYLLSLEGKQVLVLDDGPVGGGNTGRTTAHLSYYNDDGVQTVESVHGEHGAKLASESHRAAVEQIERNQREEAIDCDFHRVEAYLFPSAAGNGRDWLEKELEAAKRSGLVGGHWVEKAPIPSFDTGKCLCYPNQAQFHPLKYLKGLAEAIERRGGRICCGTHATKISGGELARVETDRGFTVTADAVVVATSTPVNDIVAMHTKQAPYRSYVVGFRVRKGAIPRALYWDTEDPYHYVRLQAIPGDAGADHECLIVGGEDHKTGQAKDPDVRYANLEKWARERFPEIEGVEFHWSGQYLETSDYLGYIGRNPGDAKNVFIATGDSGMGMTHGTIASILLRDLMLGRENPWAKLYDPSRSALREPVQFVKENANVAAMYGDWVRGGTVKDVGEIAPDMGAVMQRGLSKVAVYRNPDGTLVECSAVCPHLGCVVRWNYGERTWDCPCHGSRFLPTGEVVDGPANRGLERM